jgi:hypothetical protein
MQENTDIQQQELGSPPCTDAVLLSCSYYEVDIYVHNIRDGSGNGGYSMSTIDLAINHMQNTFLEFLPLIFNLEGINNVDSDFLYFGNHELNERWRFWDNVMQGNAGLPPADARKLERNSFRIDILLYPPLHEEEIPGVAKGNFGTEISVGGLFNGQFSVNTNILAHEMGHALGLVHEEYCGNIMQTEIRDVNCLLHFEDWQIARMIWIIESQKILRHAVRYHPNATQWCCDDCHCWWELPEH